MVVGLASDLRAAGVERGDRVALVVPNGREMSVAMLGVCSAAVAAPLNPAYREQEFADYFREIRVKHLVVRRGEPSEARSAAAAMGIGVLELAPGAAGILPPGGRDRAVSGVALEDPAPDDVALILLTSGSTGRSKKVPLTHRNICVSVADVARTLELTPADRCLCMWEQFHIGGLVDLLLVPLASGGTVICTGGFDAAKFYQLLPAARPTWYQGVPATVHELLAYARKQGIGSGRSTLRLVRVTASALSPKLMAELEEFFGVPVITTFGMTEAAPLITTNLLPPHVRKAGSTGPSCGPQIAITDEWGKFLAPGEVGEVMIRGANVFAGYEDAPEANARSFRDGWFRTGDTGYLDKDGYLFLKGRIKESINRGGEKITPQEIDDVLLTHPEIAEAVTFHVPHRVLGEDVAAAIVLRRPGALSEDDVRRFVAERMVEFKVPRKVVFVEGFERNASGKVNRSTLAAKLALENSPDFEEPTTEMEKTIAAIWQKELNVPRVGATDSFTDLGGSSLSAARVMLEMQNRIPGCPSLETVSLLGIATAPLRDLAAKISALARNGAAVAETAEQPRRVARRLDEFGLKAGASCARLLERILPLSVLRAAFWPRVAQTAFGSWLVYRKYNWKSPLIPDALRCTGSSPAFVWREKVSYRHLRMLTYFPDRLGSARWAKRIRVEGIGHLRGHIERGEPVILATLHFGHLYLLRYLLAVHGIDCMMFVDRLARARRRTAHRDSLLVRSRENRKPLPPFMSAFSTDAVAEAMRFLHGGGALLIAVDKGVGQRLDAQIPGGAGYFRMAAGAIKLARTSGAGLHPCLLSEEKPWHLVLHIGAAVEVGAEDRERENQKASDALAAFFWPVVSARPDLLHSAHVSFWRSEKDRAG